MEFTIQLDYPTSGTVGEPLDVTVKISRAKGLYDSRAEDDFVDDGEYHGVEDKEKEKEKETKEKESTQEIKSLAHRNSLRYEIVQGGDWIVVGHTKRYFTIKVLSP